MNLPAYAGVVSMIFSSLSLAVPSAPAGIGVVHYGLYLAVRLLNGVSPSLDVNIVGAFTIVVHFFTAILMDLVIGGGILLFFRVRSGNGIFGKIGAETKYEAAASDQVPHRFPGKENEGRPG
jgi:hypothetical protein